MRRKLIAMLLVVTMTASLAACHASFHLSRSTDASQPAAPEHQEPAAFEQSVTAEQNTNSSQPESAEDAGQNSQERQSVNDTSQSLGQEYTSGAAESSQSQSNPQPVQSETPAPKINPEDPVAQELNKVFHKNPEAARNWLYDYLFGQSVSEEGKGDASKQTDQSDPDTEAVVAALKTYLQESDYLTRSECVNTKIPDVVNVRNRTKDEIYADLDGRNLPVEMWMEFYHSMSKKAQGEVQACLPKNQDSTKREKITQPNLAGEGYEWLVGALQTDNNSVRVWTDFNEETKKMIPAAPEVREDSSTTSEVREDSSASSGESDLDKQNPSSLPIRFILQACAGVAVFAGGYLLRQSGKRKGTRTRRKLSEGKPFQNETTQPSVHQENSDCETMNPAMREEFKNATYYRPEYPKSSSPCPKKATDRSVISSVMAPAAPEAQTAPAAPVVPVLCETIKGYYSLAFNTINSGRYGYRDYAIFLEDRSSGETGKLDAPYVVYSDHSMSLNEEYVKNIKSGTGESSLVWKRLMGNEVQLEHCFELRLQSTGEAVTDKEGTNYEKMKVQQRAQLDNQGKLVSKGTILLE